MDEKELREIAIELAHSLCSLYADGNCASSEPCMDYCALYKWAEKAIRAGYRKIPEGSVVISKEEYEDLCNDYDKVYEQAKADILSNIANGGTSCHWCIDNHKEQARKETAKEILQVLLQYGDRDEALRRHIFDIADEYGVEVEE